MGDGVPVVGYSSTLWTLVLLADSKVDPGDIRFQKPLATIADHFFDSEQYGKINGVVEFFNLYQRFDDGDFKTPSKYPYFSNRSCYGKHTCYWGITKLLKGRVYNYGDLL